MGVTYFQYLNEIRLSHIYRDLTSTDLPLKVLLEKHGFTNYKLFRKCFMSSLQPLPVNTVKMPLYPINPVTSLHIRTYQHHCQVLPMQTLFHGMP